MQRRESVFINQILIINAHLVTNATCHDPKINFPKYQIGTLATKLLQGSVISSS
jgi:hypothetical protein